MINKVLPLISVLNILLCVVVFTNFQTITNRVQVLQAQGVVPPFPVEEEVLADDGEGDKAKESEATKTVEVADAKALEAIAPERIVAFGERVYQAKGGNSCNDCHGTKGYEGRLKTAANLTLPSTWQAYKHTKGDLAAMKDIVIEVIRYGAGPWNGKHPAPSYDVTMLGVVQGVSKSELRKIRKELKKKDGLNISMDQALDLGAEATYAYIESLWKDDALSKAAPVGNEAAPKEPAKKEDAPAAK